MSTDLNTLDLPSLFEALDCRQVTRTIADLARREDLGPDLRDATSLVMIDEAAQGSAELVCRADGRLAGAAAIPEIINVFDESVAWRPLRHDGDDLQPGDVVGTLTGSLRSILTLERTLLNLVSRLCGVATTTRAFARTIDSAGATRAKLFDTRKTTPGLRSLEKYAVRCGGGCCHRIGLFDAVLVKDNHLAGVPETELADALREAAAAARSRWSDELQFFEVEVDTFEQLERVLEVEEGFVNIVLLDNMSTDELRRAVSMRDERRPGIELEASGGVELTTIGEIALSGVDRISVGALTHSAPILDLALDIRAEDAD